MPSMSEYATDLKKQADGLRKRAEDMRKEAGKTLEELAERLSEATNDYAKHEKEAGTIREQLAQIATPADGESLVAKLERTVSFMATVQATLLEAQAQMVSVKNDAEVAQKQLDDAKRRLTEAEEMAARAKKLGEEFKSLKKALSTEPVKTLIADATRALSGEVLTKAEARIKKDIPDVLRSRAIERRKAEDEWQSSSAKLATEVRDELSELLDEDRGVAETVKHKYVEFEKAQDALRDVVKRGTERYDQALAILKRIGDPEVSPLTADQVSRIKGLKVDGTADAALKTARQKALGEEHKVLVKRVERDAKAAMYEEARLEAMAKKKDPSTDPKVGTAKQAWDTAKKQYQDALNEWQKPQAPVKEAAELVRKKETALRDVLQEVLRQKKDPTVDPKVKDARKEFDDATKTTKRP